MKLDVSKLENVRKRGNKTIAACPACRECGRDKSGDNLAIFENDVFACAANQGDKEHDSRILQLAGSADWRETRSTSRPFAQTEAPQLQAGEWAADCERLRRDTASMGRVAKWRALPGKYVDRLASAGVMGLHDGRICFPVCAHAGRGDVVGRHVFSWSEERDGEHGKSDAWFSPPGEKPLPPLLLGWPATVPTEAAVTESQWDALSVLHALKWDGKVRERPFVVTRGTSPTATLSETLAGVETVWLWMQRDKPKADGSIPSEDWLKRCGGLLPASVHAVWRIDPPPGFKDWNDAQRGMDPEAFRKAIAAAKDSATAVALPEATEVRASKHADREPIPLPSSIPVPAFNVDRLLPHSLRGYVSDCAERLQVDASFIAVPLLVFLGAVMGNRLGLRPKLNDDWTEFPNLWGAVVGRPATLKSPALSAALRFVSKLEAAANEAHKQAVAEWRLEAAAADVRRAAARENAKKAAKSNLDFDASKLVAGDDHEEPACRRFITNDATPEALHALLSRDVNATGVMVFADELSGLLSRLNDVERGGPLRAFMLSAWGGHQSAVVDRVGRGENLRVDRCCVSVLGGIQPGKIARLVDGAVKESVEDDGWLQRLSLLVWPDVPKDFKVIDRIPDSAAFAEVMSIFEKAETTKGADWPGAERDEIRGDFFLRLEASAAETFKKWMERETKTLRTEEIGAALESHFIKYRKLVPGLALLFHVASEPEECSVSMESLVRALEWVPYLKDHAMRVYGSGRSTTAATAGRILQRIKRGNLQPRFRARDVKRPAWAGLTDGEAVDAALVMLEDYGWLRGEEQKPAIGRSTKDFIAHAKIFET